MAFLDAGGTSQDLPPGNHTPPKTITASKRYVDVWHAESQAENHARLLNSPLQTTRYTDTCIDSKYNIERFRHLQKLQSGRNGIPIAHGDDSNDRLGRSSLQQMSYDTTHIGKHPACGQLIEGIREKSVSLEHGDLQRLKNEHSLPFETVQFDNGCLGISPTDASPELISANRLAMSLVKPRAHTTLPIISSHSTPPTTSNSNGAAQKADHFDRFAKAVSSHSSPRSERARFFESIRLREDLMSSVDAYKNNARVTPRPHWPLLHQFTVKPEKDPTWTATATQRAEANKFPQTLASFDSIDGISFETPEITSYPSPFSLQGTELRSNEQGGYGCSNKKTQSFPVSIEDHMREISRSPFSSCGKEYYWDWVLSNEADNYMRLCPRLKKGAFLVRPSGMHFSSPAGFTIVVKYLRNSIKKVQITRDHPTNKLHLHLPCTEKCKESFGRTGQCICTNRTPKFDELEDVIDYLRGNRINLLTGQVTPLEQPPTIPLTTSRSRKPKSLQHAKQPQQPPAKTPRTENSTPESDQNKDNLQLTNQEVVRWCFPNGASKEDYPVEGIKVEFDTQELSKQNLNFRCHRRLRLEEEEYDLNCQLALQKEKFNIATLERTKCLGLLEMYVQHLAHCNVDDSKRDMETLIRQEREQQWEKNHKDPKSSTSFRTVFSETFRNLGKRNKGKELMTVSVSSTNNNSNSGGVLQAVSDVVSPQHQHSNNNNNSSQPSPKSTSLNKITSHRRDERTSYLIHGSSLYRTRERLKDKINIVSQDYERLRESYFECDRSLDEISIKIARIRQQVAVMNQSTMDTCWLLQYKYNRSLECIMRLYKGRWYHPNITKSQALKLMKPLPASAFLIRPSSQPTASSADYTTLTLVVNILRRRDSETNVKQTIQLPLYLSKRLNNKRSPCSDEIVGGQDAVAQLDAVFQKDPMTTSASVDSNTEIEDDTSENAMPVHPLMVPPHGEGYGGQPFMQPKAKPEISLEQKINCRKEKQLKCDRRCGFKADRLEDFESLTQMMLYHNMKPIQLPDEHKSILDIYLLYPVRS